MSPSFSRVPARRPLALTILAACLASGGAGASTPVADRVFLASKAAPAFHDSVIVYYRNDAAPADDRSKAALTVRAKLDADLARVGKSLGLELQHRRRLGTGGHVIAVDNRTLDAAEVDRLLLALASNPDVVSVEPNIRLHANVLPNDGFLPFQWGLTEAAGGINIEPAWDSGVNGSNIVIAVVDTGRTPHPDLDAKTLAGIDMISDTGNSRDGHGRDADPTDQGDWNSAGECGPNSGERASTWHGTHVAGIAAALTNNFEGIASPAHQSAVQHVRVLGTCGGTTEDIADGIVWASGGQVPGLPVNPTPARVINLSLGGLSACSTTYQAAIDSARSRGSVLIVAAGNDNVPASQATPANCNGVVTVAANNRAGARASYSNYGIATDIASPGGDSVASSADGILSTINLGTTAPVGPPSGASYDMKDGTSMAAPYVAGVAAMLLSARPQLTPDQVEAMLRNTARPFPTFCGGGCGSGILDAGAAVRAVTGTAITHYPVSVALYGAGQGTVTSAPAGIGCGTACSARFAANGTVTLTAVPAAGSRFVGWNGGCSGTAPTCNVQMQQAHAVYATFGFSVQALANGVPVSGLAGSGGGARYFSIDVPAGATNLRIETSGGSGEVDLYVRVGAEPDVDTWDCRPFVIGNVEACTQAQPAAGRYFVMLQADPSYAGVTLRASYTAPGGGAQRIFGSGFE